MYKSRDLGCLLVAGKLNTESLLHFQDDLGVRDGLTSLVLLNDVGLLSDLLQSNGSLDFESWFIEHEWQKSWELIVAQEGVTMPSAHLNCVLCR